MHRVFLFCFLTFVFVNPILAQRYFMLRGFVLDSVGQAVPGASLRLRNDNLGTSSDDKGYFKLKLEEGYYELVISAIGYSSESLNIPVNTDRHLNIILKEKHTDLSEIKISSKKHDPSWSIIEKVIANRHHINANLSNYKCKGYIKASDILVVDSAKYRRSQKKIKKSPLNIDSAETYIRQSIPDMNFAEVDLVKYWGKPNLLKEERVGVRIIGDKYALYFLSTIDGEFDFYKNQVDVGKLSEVKYVSPFSPGANLSYHYKFIASYYDELSRKVYKIKISPRKIGNALFSGEVLIYDSLWIIKSLNFSLNSNPIPQYQTFSIKQTYEMSAQGFVFIKNQTFEYTKNAKTGVRNGSTSVTFANFEANIHLPAKFFGNEVSRANDSAYDRLADWWEKKRSDSLNALEHTFTKYRDSLYLVRNSKQYLDSVDRIYNELTFLKVIWWGQGYVNRQKRTKLQFAPLVSTIQPGSVGGFRLSFFASINKKFENRQAINAWPYFTYGFKNNDLKGSAYFSHLYHPIRRSRYYVYVAREFSMINNFDAYINMFRRSNYFDQKRLQVGHQTELINGLFFSSFVTFSDRKDITDYKFSPIGDQIFPNNNDPVAFLSHQSTEIKLTLSYTPKQQYIREPKEKIILGSKYPTFTLVYNQGVKNVFKSDVDFCYIQSAISQTINYGRVGIARYNIGTGKFFNQNMLPLIDYKYQRRGDPILFTSPLATYQLLPKTFPTFDWYLETHYWHNFNGFLTSGIPPFKKLNISASAGSSMLWAFENNTRHIEVYYGLNKVFKLLRETFKVGLYFAQGFNNVGGYYQGIKFSIENYNIRDNSWSF